MKTSMIIPKELPQYHELKAYARNLPEIDPDAVVAITRLLKVSLDLQAALEANFAMYGLSQGRHTTLMMVAKAYGEGRTTTPAELADMVGVTRATMTGLLDGLERDGFVERRASAADRRMIEISITPAGIRKLEDLLPDHAKRLAAVMAPLSLSEKRSLVRLLMKVAPALSALTAPRVD